MTRQPDLVHITKHADDDFNENGYIASVADRRRHDPVLHFEQQFLANELIHNGITRPQILRSAQRSFGIMLRLR